jgi:hypothetical protein
MVMDWVDEAVRGAAPRALGAEPAAAEQAEALARAVVAAEPRELSRITRLRRFVGGTALGIGILGLGVTAATAGPAVIDWLGWSPDIVAQRSFDLRDGSELGLCEVFIRVTPEYRNVSDEEADRRTEEARKFLTEHDWEPLISSITASEIQAAFDAEVAQRSVPTTSDGTMPPPATMSLIATQLMGDRISAEFERAGDLRQGVALEAAAGPCDDATEGPTQ